jgi:thiamine biosynthesis lipoprotein
MAKTLRETDHAFRAMSADVEVAVVLDSSRRREAEAALRDVEQLFRVAEATLSRFRLDSELSALNAAGGEPFEASPLLFSAVSASVEAARATRGLFDPTVLGMLLAAGYDRSFELLTEDRAGDPFPPGPAAVWSDIHLIPATRTIVLPAGCGLDLGGIGKGWTLDRAAELLAGFRNFAIDAGGDIAVSGRQADGSLWSIGVEDPLGLDRDLLQLELTDCAIATSTVAHRRWRFGGRGQHHLIDPRTGRPARSGVLAATVIAPSVAQAETLAKAALLFGPSAGVHFLDSVPDVEGLAVLDGGYVQRSAGIEGLQRVA